MNVASLFSAPVDIELYPDLLDLNTDIVPDPPDGPPVIEAITGKTITLSWKRPKRLDPSLGRFLIIYVLPL